LTGRVVNEAGKGRVAEISVNPDPTIGTAEGFASQESGEYDIPLHCGTRYRIIANTVRLRSKWHEVTIEFGNQNLDLILDRGIHS
jgi:hypothetical protein